jgi:Uma2 family endonuclease
MIAVEKRRYTAAEYLERERQALEKSEFFNGEIIDMAGASRNHNRIKENIAVKVGTFLENHDCQSFSSDMRVNFPQTGLYAYPDIVIVCGEPELLPDGFDNLLNPAVLIEVLSDGTEDYDRGRKFQRYRSIPTFQEYVLIDSQSVAVEVWRKNQQGQWTLVEQPTSLADTFTIQTIGLTIDLTTGYSRTTGLLSATTLLH